MERERDPLISECKEEFENLFSQLALILSDEDNDEPIIAEVTHWMPLPKAPKEDAE